MKFKNLKLLKKGFIFGVSAVLFGCASAMNPYSGSFTCPEPESGKCVSVGKLMKKA